MTWVPVATDEPNVSVRVLVEVVELGLNAAVTPLGTPDAARVTLPVKPFDGTTVMVLVPLVPGAWVNLLGVAVRL